MAYKATIISPLCSLTLVPAIEVNDEVMGDDIFLGHDTLSNRLPYQQNYMRKKYTQKVALGDGIVLQFHTTAAAIDVNASITDCEGNSIFVLDVSYIDKGVYKGYDNKGNTVAYNTLQYNFRFSDYFDENDEGLYRVAIEIDYDGINTAAFRSEVIDLKEEHEGTERLEYTCDTNRLETLFEQHSTGFGRRFPFKIGAIEPKREESDFISQAQRMVKVTSYAYNLYEFYFENLTDFEVNALNYILACDKFCVNTQTFITNEEIELPTRDGITPLYQASVTVRDAELNQGITYVGTDTIVLFDRPYPFNVFFNVMEDGFSRIAVVPDARVFESDGDIDGFAADLNAGLKLQQGLKGTFSRSGTSLRYTNGQGENYRVSNENVIATKKIEMTVETFSASQQYRFQHRQFYCAVDWGDGSPMVANNFGFNSSYHIEQHTYSAENTYTATFWWAPNNVAGTPIEGTGLKFQPPFNPNGGADYSVLKNLVGYGNAYKLKELFIFYADFSGVTINTDWVKDAYMVLEQMQIISCNMDDYDFTSLNLNGTLKWSVLRAVNFGANALPVANVNNILVVLSNKLTYPTPAKNIFIKNQTPPAPPSGNGILAKNKMLAAGWVVQTD
ncbi:hypothetical protein VF03_30065 [Nostoc linckia z2]|uniref:hypothetical protein n=1 Tax=Nostoc linckia TaxID=92942 RepID=UPI000BFFA36F|nr:hypothetical protein [Nostoc linckia]PHJ63649.1 hypothetical protein VF03_30065 [Nostoc linckia z2]